LFKNILISKQYYFGFKIARAQFYSIHAKRSPKTAKKKKEKRKENQCKGSSANKVEICCQ